MRSVHIVKGEDPSYGSAGTSHFTGFIWWGIMQLSFRTDAYPLDPVEALLNESLMR